jgi:hypothetical protein
MGVLNPNSTNYVHADEPNILNLHKAMEYNTLGQPTIRTVAGGGIGGIDAFGRMQVAQPYTLFDSQHRYAENEKFYTVTTGAGTILYDANASLVNMTVSGAGSVVRETTQVFTYQPGKALEIFNSFTMDAGTTGLTQRVGYFGADNGIYLEQSDGDLYLVLRSKSSGVVTETRVAQSNWNTDTLDGTGNSKIALDITKSQIQFIDIEWLGVGTVRAGFVINGAFIIAHKFHHANLITGTYMTTASLPIRYEIISTGPGATLKHVCNTVISSGGFTPTGYSNTIGRDLSYYIMPTAGTFYHMVSIKLNDLRLDDVVIPTDISVLTSSNSNLQFKIVKNATFNSALSFTTHGSNTIDFSISNTAVNNQGEVLLSGYVVNKGQSININPQELQKLQLTRTTTSDILSVIATSDGNNVAATSNISWMEPLRN